jgi:hypothetical protein
VWAARYDVSGDTWLTALDALLVINRVNAFAAARDVDQPPAEDVDELFGEVGDDWLL